MTDVGSWRGILLYGEDAGLIRERAVTAVKQIVEDLEDPFRVARLEGEEQDRLEEEATALSLIGGRRVVWVQDAQDRLAPLLNRVLQQENDTLLVLEGGGLSARSKLRVLAEKHPRFAAIGCYPEEGAALSRTIAGILAEDNIQIDREAMAWLLGHLGSNRLLVRSELEKLRLYGGKGAHLTLEDVRHCVGDTAGGSLEEAVYRALSGDRLAADQALERALADGANPIAFARVVLNVLERLWQVSLAVAGGKSRSEAMAGLRPPVFFRRKESFQRALDRWSRDDLIKAASATQELEWQCKQTGTSDLLLCRRHLVRLCQPKM
nr:DNA polymerase III subunit delta [Saccharibacter sp. 17.LH.SD]